MVRPALETMTDRELLMELVDEKRRQDKTRYIKYGIIAAIIIIVVILLAVYVPPVLDTFKKIDGAVDMMQSEMDTIKGSFDEAMGKLSEFEEFADMFSGFENIGDKLSAFEELGEKLGELDFDAFNEVITKLNNLVNKVPWLFN